MGKQKPDLQGPSAHHTDAVSLLLQFGKYARHLDSFWREADMLARLNHPNVLRLYGVVTNSPSDLSVVGIMTEVARGGSLTANLRCAKLIEAHHAHCDAVAALCWSRLAGRKAVRAWLRQTCKAGSNPAGN